MMPLHHRPHRRSLRRPRAAARASRAPRAGRGVRRRRRAVARARRGGRRAARRRRATSTGARARRRPTSSGSRRRPGDAVDARPGHLHVAGVVRRRAAGRRRGAARPSTSRWRRGAPALRARAAARPSRRARPGDGLLPASTTSRSAAAHARARGLRARRHRGLRRAPRQRHAVDVLRRPVACCTSRRTSSRTTRAPARPTRSGAAPGAGFTVNVPARGRRRPTPTTTASSREVVVPVLDGVRARTCVLVSAGFDAHAPRPARRACA